MKISSFLREKGFEPNSIEPNRRFYTKTFESIVLISNQMFPMPMPGIIKIWLILGLDYQRDRKDIKKRNRIRYSLAITDGVQRTLESGLLTEKEMEEKLNQYFRRAGI